MLTLWLWSFFCYPRISMELICLHTFTWHEVLSMFTLWHGLFSLVLMFPGLKIKVPPLSTVHGNNIHTIFKAENQEIQYLLLCTKPSIQINISFYHSRVGSLEADLSANRATQWPDLSAIHVTIVELSELIFRPSVPS